MCYGTFYAMQVGSRVVIDTSAVGGINRHERMSDP